MALYSSRPGSMTTRSGLTDGNAERPAPDGIESYPISFSSLATMSAPARTLSWRPACSTWDRETRWFCDQERVRDTDDGGDQDDGHHQLDEGEAAAGVRHPQSITVRRVSYTGPRTSR